ncbi:MAG TPA: phosphoribosylanthranilate isomerase [Anaerolineales bacterium]|nr:phosphoribosylanthranilate isomerase [Anaerolineales bacterium]
MIVQVYAFTRIDQAVAAAEMGVDHIGFVAGAYGLVQGELSFNEARRLAQALPPHSKRVALTMATQVEEILRMAEAVGPDIIHISTDLEDVGLAAMEELRKQLPASIKTMKAIQVEGEESLAQASRFAAVSDLLLLDSKVRGLPGIGATGRTHDWTLSQRIVASSPVPVILAGGLSPENIGQAIAAVQPWGVDSNTWTNLPGSPVEKDLERIRAFVQAVREAAPG